MDEPRLRPERADRANPGRVGGVLEEQGTAGAKRRHLADVVAERALPARDLLARAVVGEQAAAIGLCEAAREVDRVVVGERVHVGERDLVLGRRVGADPHAVDQPVRGEILLDERPQHAGEAERLPGHAGEHRRHGRELA